MFLYFVIVKFIIVYIFIDYGCKGYVMLYRFISDVEIELSGIMRYILVV